MSAGMLLDPLILLVRSKKMLFPVTGGKDSNEHFHVELSHQSTVVNELLSTTSVQLQESE